MDYKIFESMNHPVRMKIIQEIIKKEQATTKDIAKVCSDVPQATLYRHINKLVKDNILVIESENKIRGVLEKVYKININPHTEVENVVNENNTEGILNLFYQFNLSLMTDFQKYMENEEKDIHKDVIGFRSYFAYMTDEEARELMEEIKESILKRANNEKIPTRRPRKLSTVFLPIEDK